MRAKVAKSLRRISKNVADKELKYNGYEPPKYHVTTTKVTKVANGVPQTLSKNCTRFLYKILKKNYISQ